MNATFLVWLIFAAPYQTNRKCNLKLYTKNQISFVNTNVENSTWHFTHPVERGPVHIQTGAATAVQ
jgi:hypothetical protein